MATVQISFTDASNNEDSFSIYRGDNSGSTPVKDDANKVATLSWSGSAWSIANGSLASDANIETLPDPLNRDEVGQQFAVRYSESGTGTFKYGVIASNSIGDSDMTVTGSGVLV
jgi:hypothetical protein